MANIMRTIKLLNDSKDIKLGMSDRWPQHQSRLAIAGEIVEIDGDSITLRLFAADTSDSAEIADFTDDEESTDEWAEAHEKRIKETAQSEENARRLAAWTGNATK